MARCGWVSGADDHSPVGRTADIGQLDPSGEPRLRRLARENAVKAISLNEFRAEILEKVAALTP